MSFCKSCGSELAIESDFCQSCGARSVDSEPQTPAGVSTAGSVVVPSEPAFAASPSVMATNVASTLAYVAGFITGTIFLILDPYKSNSVVRFHAYQSIFFNVAWFAFWIVWMIVSAILTPLSAGLFGLIALPLILIFSLVGFCLWAFLMYQAYQQKLFRLPIVGKFAAQYAGVRL
jgi:uncharacterized membrane protein